MSEIKDWNIKHINSDVYFNVVGSATSESVRYLEYPAGMWGYAMFGSPSLMGSFIDFLFESGMEYNITSPNEKAYITYSGIESVFLINKSGMWGSAMFGSPSLLGSIKIVA